MKETEGTEIAGIETLEVRRDGRYTTKGAIYMGVLLKARKRLEERFERTDQILEIYRKRKEQTIWRKFWKNQRRYESKQGWNI